MTKQEIGRLLKRAFYMDNAEDMQKAVRLMKEQGLTVNQLGLDPHSEVQVQNFISQKGIK